MFPLNTVLFTASSSFELLLLNEQGVFETEPSNSVYKVSPFGWLNSVPSTEVNSLGSASYLTAIFPPSTDVTSSCSPI